MNCSNRPLKYLIILGFLMITAGMNTGCQQSADSQGNTLEATLGLGSDCLNEAASLDFETLQINGKTSAAVGQKVQFQLDQKIGCAQSKAVSWKSGTTLMGYGSKVMTSFKQAGIYMVSANIDTEVIASKGVQKSSESESAIVSLRTGIAGLDILIVGPQVGYENQSYQFSLALPPKTSLTLAEWDFGNGSAKQNTLSAVKTTFAKSGTYTISVRTVDSDSVEKVYQQKITIIEKPEGDYCPIDYLDIIGPTVAISGQSDTHSVYIPSCLTEQITSLKWSFADGSAPALNQSVTHVYFATGTKNITVDLYRNKETKAWITLNRQINVVAADFGTPSPEPSPDPGSEPVDPSTCFSHGAQRSFIGEIYSVTSVCGTAGTKTSSYRDYTVQECELVGEFLTWVEISKTTQLMQEGECQSQACPDFGVHGTKKTDVQTGQISVPVSCPYDEPGIASIYAELSDQTCNNGQVINSNTHQGNLITAGQCPTYSWVGTDQYSACSANCGGSQTQIFQCQDNLGKVAHESRCPGTAPVQTRICDGNPEAVRSSSSTTATEEAGSSTTCPKNQIGVIVKQRDVTVTETMACIDHKVQLESKTTTYSAWVTESYCRDFVAYRCSNDSLSTAAALGRYQWMVKCQDSVPIIKEFLEKFDDVHSGTFGLDDGTRHLYATFMDTATKKVWVAPTSNKSSCTIPATAYIAAVCVSSCATPEQQIVAQAQAEKQMHPLTFIEAFTRKVEWVGTMKSDSQINSKSLDKTAVDNWVTELEDTTQEVLTFNMKSGGQLRLTVNHPLLSSAGSMKLARDFKVGDNLVQLGGKLDTIVSIQSIQYTGKVYNVFVKSNDLKKNIVVINGYLSGTAFYQNEGTQYMNRSLFREQLTNGVFKP